MISDSFMPQARKKGSESPLSAHWRTTAEAASPKLMRDMPSMLRTGRIVSRSSPMTGSLTEAMPSAMLVPVWAMQSAVRRPSLRR